MELALRGCGNIDLERMTPLAALLLEAGAKKTSRMKDFVEQIGERFEFHRANFNPALVGAASDALDRLYTVFDVPPVRRRQLHDGKSQIVVKASSWQEQHPELWDLLVPSQGHAATIQGEVIRISGRIAHELDGNGGLNWNSDFKKMADAFRRYVEAGNPLSPANLAEVATVIHDLKRRSGDPARLCELRSRGCS